MPEEEQKVGVVAEPEKKKVISKADTMFKVDNEGKLIPELVEVEIYDRGLDQELLEESELLAQMIKRKDAFVSSSEQNIKEANDSITNIENDIQKESDEKIKSKLFVDVQSKKSQIEILKKRNEVALIEVENQIKESREIIVELKKKKEEETKKEFVEAVPLTTAEAYLVFEKNKSPLGKDTDDAMADMIAHCIKNPSYSFDEAKKIKLDFKLAIRDAIMELSNYSKKSYRDVILEKLRSDIKKPESGA